MHSRKLLKNKGFYKMKIRQLSSKDENFSAELDALLAYEATADEKLEATVAAILNDVRLRGDAAVLEYTGRFDRLALASAPEMELPRAELRAAFEGLPADQRAALEAAAQRVTDYHQKQLQASWSYTDADGTLLGQQVTRWIGLDCMCGRQSGLSVVSADECAARQGGGCCRADYGGSDTRWCQESAGAGSGIPVRCGSCVYHWWCTGRCCFGIRYGNHSKVDKIVGPGNAYVAAAKRRVFGICGIDMIAGPSEILVICDGLTNPDWIAMDLFSQAEHDELAQAILLSPDAGFIQAVAESADRLLAQMPRREIIKTALENRGALIHVASLEEACAISNRIAPEHLEMSVADPQAWLPKLKHAGAIFMGRHTSEALGDYCAGPNHVLPTSGTARFSSPLGVYDFQKRSSLIMVSEQGAQTLGKIAATLAFGEGLQAHAQSALYRSKIN